MIEALDVVAASTAGCCVALGLRWLGVVTASSLWRWLNEGVSIDAVHDTAGNPVDSDKKCEDCGSVAASLTCFGRCWDCYGASCAALAARLSATPTPHRVATPIEHVEVAANKLTSVGFLAMSVRVNGGAGLSEAEYDAVVSMVETAAARLKGELKLCRGCRRWGGEHAVRCGEVREMVDMGCDEMLCEHKEDLRYGDG